jgi:micrococcal nuclease
MGTCISSNTEVIDLTHIQSQQDDTTINQVDWGNISYKDTIQFRPEITAAKCIKVYDGDTITIACGLPPYQPGNPIYRWSVRLRGIDAPEMRSKCANEKGCATYAKEIMAAQVLDKIVTLENVSYDKYGRVLADVFVDSVNVTDKLLANNLAVPYDGGTKQTPNDWFEFHALLHSSKSKNRNK